MMNYARIFLNPKEDREISQGFPWVYDNEISSVKYEDSKAGIKTVSLEDFETKCEDLITMTKDRYLNNEGE